MSIETELEQRIADLRAERTALLDPRSKEVARRTSLFREFAEYDDGNDKSDSAVVEARLEAFMQSKGLHSPRTIFTIDAELADAQVELARARKDPVAIRVCLDVDSLDRDDQSGREFRPDLSGSGEVFVQTEFGRPLLVLRGSLWGGEGYPEDLGTVAITFTKASPLPLWGLTLAKFGFPNEEAFGEWMVTGFQGIGFYEVLNSTWPREVVKANREAFPETPDDLGLRHFMVACKENTLEILAKGFTVSRIQDRSWLTTVTEHLQV